jgi:ParB family chromosome partitioning protein
MAGLPTMSCIIMEGAIEPSELLALQLIENCVREDLKPIEQARAYRALMDWNGWTVSQVARELAIDHSNVSRALALLDLPTVVQEQVEQGTLAPATAYEISKVEDPAAQAELAGRVLAEGLSRREAVAEVRRAAGGPTTKAKGKGAARGRKETSRVFRTPPAGTKVTVENKRGPDDPTALTAVEEVARQLRDKMGASDPPAA